MERYYDFGSRTLQKGQKISKSKGNSKSGPEQLIDQYSADVIRYWTAGAKLGSDCYFEENEFKIAAKLVTKIQCFKICTNASGES